MWIGEMFLQKTLCFQKKQTRKHVSKKVIHIMSLFRLRWLDYSYLFWSPPFRINIVHSFLFDTIDDILFSFSSYFIITKAIVSSSLNDIISCFLLFFLYRISVNPHLPTYHPIAVKHPAMTFADLSLYYSFIFQHSSCEKNVRWIFFLSSFSPFLSISLFVQSICVNYHSIWACLSEFVLPSIGIWIWIAFEIRFLCMLIVS